MVVALNDLVTVLASSGFSGPTWPAGFVGWVILVVAVVILALARGLGGRRPGQSHHAMTQPLHNPVSFVGGARWSRHGISPVDAGWPLMRLVIADNGLALIPGNALFERLHRLPHWTFQRDACIVHDVGWGVGIEAKDDRPLIVFLPMGGREKILQSFTEKRFTFAAQSRRPRYLFY